MGEVTPEPDRYSERGRGQLELEAARRVIRRILVDARTNATPSDPVVIDYWALEVLKAIRDA